MKRRLGLPGVAVAACLAGCIASPDARPAAVGPHYGLLAKGQGGAPPPPPPPPPAARSISIDAGVPLHHASPFVNGFNRNHSHRQFALRNLSYAAYINAMRRLEPAWGGSYVQDQVAAGFPVDPARRSVLRTGHGPTDGRTDFTFMLGYFFNSMWGLDGQATTLDGYPYDDFRYPLQEAEDEGAQCLVTVNFGTGTADDATALAGMLASPAHALRQAHPYGAPPFTMAGEAYTPFMYEIGNEVQLSLMRGHEKARSIDQYVANAAPYVTGIRAAAGYPVKVALAATVNAFWGGPTTPPDGWAQREAMVGAFMGAARTAGIGFDALQIHTYPSFPVTEKLAGVAYEENFLSTRIMPEMTRQGATFELWDDELHAATGLAATNTGLYGALFQAASTVMAFKLSYGGRQLIPVMGDFAPWHAGTAIDSLYFQNNSPAAATPIYHFRRLLARDWGDTIVSTRVAGVGSWTDRARNGEVTTVPNLTATSALSADGATLYLLVVNTSQRTDETVGLRLAGFAAAPARLSRITSTRGWTATWDQTVVTENVPLNAAGAVAFPHASISLIAIPRVPPPPLPPVVP
ncbi:MAG: hypothetical protein JWM80_3418 [Cyanobacteria bacterium RYN_339]|nr:hypothetical protein [Cyanobacteria bacterium RYN_339]